MYDTAIRVALVKQRVRENTRWMQLRHDTAVGEHERPCAGERRFLCSGSSDYRAVHSAQKQRKSEKGGTSKSNRNEQEEKAYEETNTQHPAHLVYGAMPYANGGLCRG